MNDPQTGQRLPHDGKAMGEIVLRGNTLMKGYHKDQDATVMAFTGGVFHDGDLAVQHTDGFLEIRDRSRTLLFLAVKISPQLKLRTFSIVTRL